MNTCQNRKSVFLHRKFNHKDSANTITPCKRNITMYGSAAMLLSMYYLGRRAVFHFLGSSVISSTIKPSFYKYIWQEAARAIGGSIIDVGNGIYEIHYRDKFTRVCQNYTSLDDIMTMKIAGNKSLVLSLLSNNKISVPRFMVSDICKLKVKDEFISSIMPACVVKPADGTGAGAGVCANITNKWGLVKSAARVGAYGKKILIEEQIAGNNYRLLYLNGQFLDAVLRNPPSVKGDGKSSIKALVRKENALRIKEGWNRAQTLITIDTDMKNCLQNQGLSLNSILPDEKTINVKTVINENNSSENERVSGLICQSIINDGAKAVKLIGAKIAGVDIITKDLSVPLHESKGVIIEVNTTPGYYFHYQNTKKAFHVANHVLEVLFKGQKI